MYRAKSTRCWCAIFACCVTWWLLCYTLTAPDVAQLSFTFLKVALCWGFRRGKTCHLSWQETYCHLPLTYQKYCLCVSKLLAWKRRFLNNLLRFINLCSCSSLSYPAPYFSFLFQLIYCCQPVVFQFVILQIKAPSSLRFAETFKDWLGQASASIHPSFSNWDSCCHGDLFHMESILTALSAEDNEIWAIMDKATLLKEWA